MNTVVVVLKYVLLITAVTQPTRWTVRKLGFSENAASAIAMGLGNYVGRTYLEAQKAKRR